MRTIHLVQTKGDDWFVRTTSGGDIVHSTEIYSSASHAMRAFGAEGRNNPFARMCVERPGAKPTVVRKGRPAPRADDVHADVMAAARAALKR